MLKIQKSACLVEIAGAVAQIHRILFLLLVGGVTDETNSILASVFQAV